MELSSIWRTRLQPIRTMVEISVEEYLKAEPQFLYQKMSGKVLHLLKLGMKKKEIARSMGLCPRTIRKAARWKRENLVGFTREH